jgi:predicted RNA binding protein with dsRBD fold (UPF0201 family)
MVFLLFQLFILKADLTVASEEKETYKTFENKLSKQKISDAINNILQKGMWLPIGAEVMEKLDPKRRLLNRLCEEYKKI